MQAMLDDVAPKLKVGVPMLSETVRADAREGDVGIQLGEIAKANPEVAIGSSVLRSTTRGQHECGATSQRCTEARASQTRGRGHVGASAASTKRLSLGSASNINELHFCALPVSCLASASKFNFNAFY
jgi:hypothetical protein